MTNVAPLTVYTANERGNAQNCMYPNRIEITDEESAVAAFSRDLVCAEYKNNYRSVQTFLRANALPMDCDNDHSDDPAHWITAEDIDSFIPGVTYLIHYSHHHMKPKGEKSARPRFHVIFLIDPTTDPNAYVQLKKRVAAVFPFFDSNAMDAARFLYAIPRSSLGDRDFYTTPIDESVKNGYTKLIRSMLEVDEREEPITLSVEATVVLERLFRDTEIRFRTDLAEITDWAGKYVGAVLRIAGLLHVAVSNGVPDFWDVSEETMKNAVRIGEYFLEHAKAAYSLMGADLVNKQGEYLLSKIQKEQVRAFSRRDAMRMCRNFKTADSIQPVLNRLCEYGYIAPKPTEAVQGVGRKPSEVYLTNPMLLAS